MLLSAAPVWACVSVPEPPSLVGEPVDGATGVPTDVVLHYAIPDALGDAALEGTPGEYELRPASGGELVPFALMRLEPFRIELKPESPLQPNTRYTLQARWMLVNGTTATAALSFETGDGPYEGTPEPPTALLRQYELPHDYYNSCGPDRIGTCVLLANDQSWVEHTLIDGFGQAVSPTLWQGSFMLDLTGIRPGFRCVDLRTRAANGVRSQPLRLCGKDSPIHDLTGVNQQVRLQCNARGMEWCDATGASGVDPGLPNPQTDRAALSCWERPMMSQSAGAAGQIAAAGAGGAPSQSAAAGAGGAPAASAAAGAGGTGADPAPADMNVKAPPPSSDAASAPAQAPAAPSCNARPVRASTGSSLLLFLAFAALATFRARR